MVENIKNIADIHVLQQKSSLNDIYPVTYTSAVYDDVTGANLTTLLHQFNAIHLPYAGSPFDTRNQLLEEQRRKGIIISYVDLDGNTITEKCVIDKSTDDNYWGLDQNWQKIGDVIINGELTVGANGNWIINGEDIGIKAVGPKGDNGVTPIIKVIENKLYYSYDNYNWYKLSEDIAAWFRWQATEADSQSNNIGRLQISRDNKTWSTLSGDIVKNIHINKYIGADETLPTTDIAEGTIYAKGPTYAEDDTLNENPIYRLWVYAWKNDTLAWVDNGEFTSIAAGIVQETGNSETEVMSQKAITKKLSELSSEIDTLDKAINGGVVYDTNDITSSLVWTEGYHVLAAGTTDEFGTAKQLSSGKRDASDYYELGDATSIVTTLIHPASTTSNGGLVFYDANKAAIIGEGHYLNSNTADSYTEVEIAIPSNAKYFRTTRWNTIAGVSGEFKCELKKLVGQVSEGIIGRLNKLEGLGINPIIGSPKIYQSGATDFGNINNLTVEQVYELYDDLVSLHPNYFFKREDLGTDSSGLYQLRHYTLRMGNPYVSSTYEPNNPSTNVWDDNTMSPRTICITAGVHGNEKTSIYGVYLSVKEILESTEEWATFIRANFVLEICPIVNCWGVDNNSRPNFNGANINRDFLEESPQAETILVKNLIKGCHNLHAVLDSHNSTYVTGVGSVNLGYLPTNNTFRFHNYYCQVAAKLASALYPRMKELFNRNTQKPYIVAWISNNSGTLMDYVNNELNLIGGTLEAPNSDFGISDASLNNNSKWCEVTKDLLINTIQLYGCQNV